MAKKTRALEKRWSDRKRPGETGRDWERLGEDWGKTGRLGGLDIEEKTRESGILSDGTPEENP